MMIGFIMANVVSEAEVGKLVAKLLGINLRDVFPHTHGDRHQRIPDAATPVERRIFDRGDFRTSIEFTVPNGTGKDFEYAVRAAKLSGCYCLVDDGSDPNPDHYVLVAPDGTTQDADLDIEALEDDKNPVFILRTPVEGGLLTKPDGRTIRP